LRRCLLGGSYLCLHFLADSETLHTFLVDPLTDTTPHESLEAIIRDRLQKATHEAYKSEASCDPTKPPEPKGRKQALAHPDRDRILAAEKKELDSFYDENVFELVKTSTLPSGTEMLPSHWVYKMKYGIDPATGRDVFIRWRARLVIGGNRQTDFTESFAATPSFVTIRLVLAITTNPGWKVESWDLASAFCRTPIGNRGVFVHPPQGSAPPGHVWRLNYAVYGLKDSNAEYSRLRDSTILNFRSTHKGQTLRFKQSEADRCLFVISDQQNRALVILVIYIDDLILCTKINHIAQEFIAHLNKIWRVDTPDGGNQLNRFLGIHFSRTPTGGWKCSANAYIQNMCTRYDRYPLRSPTSPLPPNFSVDPADWANYVPCPKDVKHYQSIVGSLIYAATALRFDLCYAVSILAQYMTRPTELLMKAAYQTLAYAKSTSDLTITYELPTSLAERNKLFAACDAGFGACRETRRSQEGGITFLNGGFIYAKSKREPLVTLSTAEAELVSLVSTAKEVIHECNILADLGFPQSRVPISEDNQAAIAISLNQMSTTTSRTIQQHFCSSCVARQFNVHALNALFANGNTQVCSKFQQYWQA